MSFELPEFVEIGPRIYTVELREGYAWDFPGLRCHIDHDEQAIYLNADAVPEDQRAAVLADAGQRVFRRCRGWRMIPLVGKIG